MSLLPVQIKANPTTDYFATQSEGGTIVADSFVSNRDNVNNQTNFVANNVPITGGTIYPFMAVNNAAGAHRWDVVLAGAEAGADTGSEFQFIGTTDAGVPNYDFSIGRDGSCVARTRIGIGVNPYTNLDVLGTGQFTGSVIAGSMTSLSNRATQLTPYNGNGPLIAPLNSMAAGGNTLVSIPINVNDPTGTPLRINGSLLLTFALQGVNTDGVNNASWVYGTSTTSVAAAQKGLTYSVPATTQKSFSDSMVLKRGVDYNTTDTAINLVLAAGAGFPNSRIDQWGLNVTLVPLP